MKKVAKFEKVSFKQFLLDWQETFGKCSEEYINSVYNAVKLPKRATVGSAGYDFFSPMEISIKAGEGLKIPTGIRVKLMDGWLLSCYPRSGLGFKYRLQLDNTVGIIDSDYFYSNNEGHIMAKVTNDSRENKTINVKLGEGFMQGVFTEYAITDDDDCVGIRNGGFGSTTK